jgi:hypothetical protein
MPRGLKNVSLTLGGAALVAAFILPFQHDYTQYLSEWHDVTAFHHP